MSCQPETSPVLKGQEGELVFVTVRVDPRHLENLLDALASLDFPINPEIRHGHPDTRVEFPAYDRNIEAIQSALQRPDLDDSQLETWRWLAGVNPAGTFSNAAAG